VAAIEPGVILLAVGRYLRFSLSYRDVEELLAERGLSVDHVTVWRWVQRYAPEIQRIVDWGRMVLFKG
jgi:IS6 family transposase